MGDVIDEDELAAFHRTVGRLRELPVDDPVRLRAEQVAASFARDGRLRRRKARGAETAIADVLASTPRHRLTHLVLTHTGMRSREAHRLLDTASRATTATRFVLGQGIAATVRHRLAAHSAHIPPPSVPADVAAVRSVHRTRPTGAAD